MDLGCHETFQCMLTARSVGILVAYDYQSELVVSHIVLLAISFELNPTSLRLHQKEYIDANMKQIGIKQCITSLHQVEEGRTAPVPNEQRADKWYCVALTTGSGVSGVCSGWL